MNIAQISLLKGSNSSIPDYYIWDFHVPLHEYPTLMIINSLAGACGAPLGLEDGRIPKNAMTASSMWDRRHGPYRARLNILNRGGTGAWSSRYNNVFQWLQIYLGSVTKVVACATQGRYDANQWVKKYEISFGLFSNKFKFYAINRKVQVRTCFLPHYVISSFLVIYSFVSSLMCIICIPEWVSPRELDYSTD